MIPIQKFTVNSLKGLKAPALGQVDVWDGLMPGFGIRVSQGGRKSFFVGTRSMANIGA